MSISCFRTGITKLPVLNSHGFIGSKVVKWLKELPTKKDNQEEMRVYFRDIIQKLMGVEYQHVTRGIPLKNTGYNAEKTEGDNIFEKFISQVAYQHTLGYVDSLFDIEDTKDLHTILVNQLRELDFIPKQKSKEAGELLKTAMKHVALVSMR